MEFPPPDRIDIVHPWLKEDGLEVSGIRAVFPHSDGVLSFESRRMLVFPEQTERYERGRGADHRRGKRHRSAPGKGVREAGSKEGKIPIRTHTRLAYVIYHSSISGSF